MLNAQATQFTLGNDGQVLYQPSPNNPVPGTPVARLVKGAGPLQPGLEVLDAAPEADKEKAKTFLENWLKVHIVQVLEPLVALLEEKDGEEIKEPVKEIIARVFKNMGIVPREELESFIEALDQDDRRILRAKRIKLGPILVFQPDLNKPAGVRLRALLWSLYNDKPLPADVPNDGIVSVKVDAAAIDKDFYQAIGYPVYGSRAIRIDMLDRVMNAVYDSAEKGKFQAQHQMAEWLGCGIEDLYAVLGAMGHTKVYDPAEQAEAEAASEESASEEKPAEEKPVEEKPAADTKPQEKPQAKPELATFRLKKGKAFEKAQPRKPSAYKGQDKSGKKDAKKDGKKGKRNKSTNRTAKVMSAGPKLEDSPFAVLEQLKDKKDAG